MSLLFAVLAAFFTYYSYILIIRVLLTWFPSIDWYNQPFAALSQISDPYLNVFRSFIPPLGGIDISPMLAIILLQFLGTFMDSLSRTQAFI